MNDPNMEQLIKVIQDLIQQNSFFANLSVFEGPILTWRIGKISFDKNGKLHGVCGFQIIPEHINKTGMPDFFHWSIKFFSGRFHHGQLEGLVLWTTWQGTLMYANVRNGVLHGPAIATLRQPIYDVWVSHSSMRSLEIP